jgi:hypothetical protein
MLREHSTERKPLLWLICVGTDGTFEIFDHVESLHPWSRWRAGDPRYRVSEYWVKDQYAPKRWAVPVPDVVEYQYAIVATYDERGDLDWRLHLYAADLAARILGLEEHIEKLNRAADGFHYCPHCAKRYDLSQSFRGHLTRAHGDGGAAETIGRNDFYQRNASCRRTWAATKKGQVNNGQHH